MISLVKPVSRKVVIQDFDFRSVDFTGIVTIAAEGVYIRKPRQPQRCALFLPWTSAYQRAGELRAAQINEERAAKRKARAPKARRHR